MNNEGHGNDLQKIIAQGFNELKHIHGKSFNFQMVTLRSSKGSLVSAAAAFVHLRRKALIFHQLH